TSIAAHHVSRIRKRDFCVFEVKVPARKDPFLVFAVRQSKPNGRVTALHDFAMRPMPALYQQLPLYHVIGSYEGPTSFTRGGKVTLD
ncbi:MAG: hypothetical protein AAGN82_24985, partial [Myxococcota bacterium]